MNEVRFQVNANTNTTRTGKHSKPTLRKAQSKGTLISWFCTLVKGATCGYIFLALALAVFVAPFLNYPCRIDLVPMNFAYVILAFLVGLGICFGVLRARKAKRLQFFKSKKAFVCTVVVAMLLLLIAQAYIVKGVWFKTGWDVGALTNFGNPNVSYYSTYPNQLFLAGLFERIAKFGALMGFTNKYLCVVVVGCLCVTLSVGMIAGVAQKLAGFAAGYVTLIFASVFIGLSPWILVPYSDTYGMFFTSAALFAYVFMKRPPVKVFAVVFIVLIGYMIKPTVIFVLMAIVLVEIVWGSANLRKRNVPFKQNAKRIGFSIVAAAMAIVLALGTSAFVKDINIDIDENKAFTMTHFLMMGFNTERTGVYSADDVSYSQSFSNVADRQKANLETFKQRVNEMGPAGVIEQLAKKILINYDDGSFAWEMEGNFYKETHGSSDFLKSIYGVNDTSPEYSRTPLFKPVAQILWFVLLAGIVLLLKKKRLSKNEYVMLLAILMLSVFLMLFEARARYLFLYAPYFVCLGLVGFLSVLSDRISSTNRKLR
jgi:hypothetical protein